jgi:hypothetical protein
MFIYQTAWRLIQDDSNLHSHPSWGHPNITIFQVVGLERGPLSLVSTTEELLDIKVAAPV